MLALMIGRDHNLRVVVEQSRVRIQSCPLRMVSQCFQKTRARVTTYVTLSVTVVFKYAVVVLFA